MQSFQTLTSVLDFQASKLQRKKIYHFLDEDGNIANSLSFHDIRSVAIANGRILEEKYPNKEKVILLYPSGTSFIYAFFSCLYSGKAVVPISYKDGDCENEVFLESISLIKKEIGSNLLLVDQSFRNQINNTTFSEFEIHSIDEHINYGSENYKVKNNKFVCCIFTSGSTSQPKGVLLNHTNIINNCVDFTKSFEYDSQSITLSWLPHYHAFGLLMGLYYPLFSATPVYIMPTKVFVSSPLSWIENATKYKATHLAAPDFGYMLCAKQIENGAKGDWDLSKVKYSFSASEPVQKETFERFAYAFKRYGLNREVLAGMYGMSEASVISCQKNKKAVSKNIYRSELENNLIKYSEEASIETKTVVSCGEPVSNTDIKIVNPKTFENYSDSHVGEIWLSGLSVFEGYLNKIDNEGVWGQIKNIKGVKYFRTGDLGFISNDELYITGRLKEIIIINGKNYYPIDVEQTIGNDIKQLQNSKKVVFPHFINDIEEVSVIIEFTNKSEENELVHLAHQVFAKVANKNNLQLSNVYFVSENAIPKTPTGKIQRKKCSALFREGRLDILLKVNSKEEFVDAKKLSHTEILDDEKVILEILYSIFKKVTETKISINPLTSFYSIGIGSIELMMISDQIKRSFNKEIFVHEILSENTLLGLAQLIIKKEDKIHFNVDSTSMNAQYDTNTNFSLTSNQKGIWFELSKKSSSYQFNIPLAFVLLDNIDSDRFVLAFKAIQQKYIVLRTRIFENIHGDINQIITDKFTPLEVSEVSLNPLALRRLLHQKTLKSVIPTRSIPLIEATLYITPFEKVLFFNGSHLILDGYSCKILINELLKLYNTTISNNNDDKEYNFINLADNENDFIAIEKNVLKEYLIPKQQYLFEGISMPYDQKITLNSNEEWNHFNSRINDSSLKKLEALAKNLSITKASLLLAVYTITIYRFARQNNITIGVALLNRTNSNSMNSIGYFANILPLQLEIDGNSSFEEFSKKVFHEVSLLLNFQSYPLPEFLKEIDNYTQTNEHVFQNTFIYQEWEDFSKKENTIIKEQIYDITQSSTSDLTIDITDMQSSAVLALKYNKKKFNQSTSNAILVNYEDVLEKILNTPDISIESLQEIRKQDVDLINTVNSTHVELKEVPNIYNLFETTVNIYGDKLGISSSGIQLSFEEINQKVNQLANFLSEKGVKKGSIILLYLTRQEWIPISILALMKLGATYVPLDVTLPEKRLSYICEDVKADIIIHLSNRSPNWKLPSFINSVVIDNILLSEAPYDIKPVVFKPTDVIFIIYTSGSTGKPKGVEINHRSLINFCSSIQKKLEFDENDHILAVSTISFDIAFTEMVLPLIIGATITIASENDQKNGEALLKLLENNPISILQCTPVTWSLLFASGWKSNTMLKKALSTGEALDSSLAKKILNNGARLWNMYGPSEGTIEASVDEIIDYTNISIGKPIDNVEFYVLDKKYRQVPIGAFGELFIAGINLSNGYKNKPKMTNEKFVKIPKKINTTNNLMYKTGDIVKMSSKGNFYYYGRNDFQVKVRGYRIELSEIESVILENSFVQKACATIELKKDKKTPQIRVCLVLNENINNADLIQDFIDNISLKLPNYMMPHNYYIRKSIPLLPNGKINRKKLFEGGRNLFDQIFYTKESSVEVEYPEMENTIKKIWESILERPILNEQTSFFDSGGDSILILKLKRELEIQFPNKKIKVTDLFKYASIIEQKNWLQSNFGERKMSTSKNKISQSNNESGYQVLFE